jgi:sterol desaturase/sphingolipid hydroxylase (fatty acid hydroxylase superfamily)
LVDTAILNAGLIGWFAILACLELVCARRSGRIERSGDGRLITNFGLTLLVLIVSSLPFIVKLGSAEFARTSGVGLQPRFDLPWPSMLLALLVADSFAIYWVHRLFHVMPLLWRVHRVHHADELVDVSTSLRNHPLELLLLLPVSAAVVLIVGAQVSVVAAAQTASMAAVIWQHADIDLPARVDRLLSFVLVTPRLHRLHHSPDRRLHDSNYGELITLWDRLFGTFSGNPGRHRVGLDGQVARPDELLAQIWSPVLAA